MKNLLESKEVFSAYASIDYGYFEIAQLNEQLNKPVSQIEKMIDNVTGARATKIKENIEATIRVMKRIIAAKKIVEADYSNDEKLLQKTKDLLLKCIAT